jgi:hypothetical protein
MDRLPFSVYDFFGYLSAGFVVLLSLVAAFAGYEPLKDNPNAVVTVFLIVLAYTVGHLVANVSGDLLEHRLVRGVLSTPTGILMASKKLPGLAERFLPGYAVALPEGVRSRVAARADREGVADRGDALFFHCHALMKRDAVVLGRLDTFLNLYGFCRNMAMAAVIAAIALAAGIVNGTANTGPDVAPSWWIVIAAVAAIGLFYRYLKFLRQYGVELLTSYAEAA